MGLDQCPHCGEPIDDSRTFAEHVEDRCTAARGNSPVGTTTGGDCPGVDLADAPDRLPESVIRAHDRERERIRRLADRLSQAAADTPADQFAFDEPADAARGADTDTDARPETDGSGRERHQTDRPVTDGGTTVGVTDAATALGVDEPTVRRLTDEPPGRAALHVSRLADDETARETALAWLEWQGVSR